MFALDSNVLVYAVDKGAQAKHAMAGNIVNAASGADAALAEQSIMEFINVATKKVRLPPSDVLPFVREFQRNFELLLPSRTVFDDTLALLSRHQLSVFDARILAVCGAHGCDYLLSEDLQDGARYGSVTVLNPFAPANSNLVAGLLMP